MDKAPKSGQMCVVSDTAWICGQIVNDKDPKTKQECEANARLIAAAPDLLEALQWYQMFEAKDGEDSIDRFERVAREFRKATGYLKPGKDCRTHDPEERQAAWSKWIDEGTDRARAVIAKATGETA
ncbi:hypothetical protein J0X19_11880 [Hymenobacter sp. BT186]|uniref:Uncharacterized protein n=2 Tax=Hymenobacter telluris TaxID=2816474 RepID=A0A939JDS2_9BACT|nr:hypothetical protein [Hymenobacter telluris]MBW3374673.1 hypothetical protein [Hymenobacter norwichensis]